SRRRHTRSDRDWSSDVCSSDLERRTFLCAAKRQRYRDAIAGTGALAPLPENEIDICTVARHLAQFPLDEIRREAPRAFMNEPPRSEERRVGKECRARRRRGHWK